MEFAITKMSSKGQIVIPAEMRKDIREGEELVVIKNNHQWIIEKPRDIIKNLKEDLDFAKKTAEAWREIEMGKCKTMDEKEFFEEIEKW